MTLQGSAPEFAPRSAERPEILSDEQIEQLLQEAEARLRQASEVTVQAANRPEDQDVIAVDRVGKRKPYVCISYHVRTTLTV